jgi:hypothetical protein
LSSDDAVQTSREGESPTKEPDATSSAPVSGEAEPILVVEEAQQKKKKPKKKKSKK